MDLESEGRGGDRRACRVSLSENPEEETALVVSEGRKGRAFPTTSLSAASPGVDFISCFHCFVGDILEEGPDERGFFLCVNLWANFRQ